MEKWAPEAKGPLCPLIPFSALLSMPGTPADVRRHKDPSPSPRGQRPDGLPASTAPSLKNVMPGDQGDLFKTLPVEDVSTAPTNLRTKPLPFKMVYSLSFLYLPVQTHLPHLNIKPHALLHFI